LIVISKTKVISVYCTVRTGSLNKTVYVLYSNGLIYNYLNTDLSFNVLICANMEKSMPLADGYTKIILKYSTWPTVSGYLDTFHYIICNFIIVK